MSSNPAFSTEQLLLHSGWARSLARQLVVDAAAADDVVQETWIAALREQPSTDRPLRPWLERVIRNFAANSRRNQKTRQRHEQAAGEQDWRTASVADVVAKAEGQQRVVAAVLALSEPYRSVVLLRYFDGLSAAEISRRSKVPAGTVRWQLSQGLEKLREQLDAQEGGDRRAWCTALLPLAGFQSGQAVAAGATSSASARVGHSSFWSICQGVIAMKSAWMLAVAALGVAYGFYWFASSAGGLVLSSVGPLAHTEVAMAAAPDQVYVHREQVAAANSQTARVDDTASWNATLRMRFVDGNGVAVAGMRARLGDHPDGQAVESVSDQQGYLAAPVPTPYGGLKQYRTSLTMLARHEQFASVQRSVAASQLAGDGDAIDLGVIVLEPAASIIGQVVDGFGAPVASAVVSVSGRDSGQARTSNLLMAVTTSGDRVGVGSSTTDAQGNFRIDGVLPGANEVSASFAAGQSWVDEWAGSAEVTVAAGQTATVRLTLKKPYEEQDIVSVRVVDPDGQPVPFAYVQARCNRRQGMVHTDADGLARIGFRNAGREVDVTVSVPDNRYAAVVHKGVFLGQTVIVQFAAPVRLPLQLLSAAKRTLGKVHIRMHTAASSGFFGIGAESAIDLCSLDCEVLGDGAVGGLIVPAQAFVLEVRGHGHETTSFGPYEPEVAKLGLTLSLPACPMVVGRVVDTDGKPVVGAEVTLHRRPEGKMIYNGFSVWLDPTALEHNVSDAAGAFELTLRDGQPFFVRVVHDRYAATMSSELQGDAFVAADPGKQLVLELHQGGAIVGHVTQADGSAAAGALVALNPGDGFAYTVRADQHGDYRFERVAPGSYRVTRSGEAVGLDGASWQTTFGSAIRELEDPNCTVEAGKVSRLDLGAGHALDASLRGHIEVAGWSLVGQRVAIEFADVKEGQVSTGQWHATIAKDGRFVVPSLPSGALRLQLKDGKRLIEATLQLVPGENQFELRAATSLVILRDLPTPAAGEMAGFVMARWSRDDTTVMVPIAVAADGTAQVLLPRGKVLLERSPTESDLGLLLATGSIHLVPLREILVK